MSDHRADIQVGLFSIIGLLMLAMLILIFGGFKNILVETYEVTAIFENAAGTTEGTPVRLVGIEVGNVKSVSLNPETAGVRMRLTIDRKVDIRQDAPVAIKQEGFIANIYISSSAWAIHPTSSPRTARPWSPAPSTPSPPTSRAQPWWFPTWAGR